MTDSVSLALFRDLLRSQGRARVRATGTSMLPSIWPGDELELESIADRISVGQVVAWTGDGRLFIHRVVSVSQDGNKIVTQGDRLSAPDATFSRDALLGVVTGLTRAGRTFQPVQRLTWKGRLLRAVSRVSDRPANALLKYGASEDRR